jgi:hypothetical protein
MALDKYSLRFVSFQDEKVVQGQLVASVTEGGSSFPIPSSSLAVLRLLT